MNTIKRENCISLSCSNVLILDGLDLSAEKNYPEDLYKIFSYSLDGGIAPTFICRG